LIEPFIQFNLPFKDSGFRGVLDNSEPEPNSQKKISKNKFPQYYTFAADTSEHDTTKKSHADSLRIDSLKRFKHIKDSLEAAIGDTSKIRRRDTTKIDLAAIDSTARLKYFKYRRHDVPYVKLTMGRRSSFFVYPPANLETRSVQIDSTGKYVDIKQSIAGQRTKILLRLPLDQYIKLMLAANQEKMWRKYGYNYVYHGNKNSLGHLIKNITNFEIPLPSVGVLSIFGKPKISLRIGGAVDIHGAWRSETTRGITISRLGNTRSEPDFKQEVQINVNGTIGDKLNISADWNTQRTFEYQNQLKIKYTGYPDEIIQSIEAGNVSLQTAPLVGGGEALFGVKANFKLGPLTLTTLASQKKGQTKVVQVNGGVRSHIFSVKAWNYSQNNYFLDTVYASTDPRLNLFYKYYSSATPVVDKSKEIVDIQVWKSVNNQIYHPAKERYANAYINLYPRRADQPPYPDSYRVDTTGNGNGKLATGRFVMLTRGVDYILHPETGYITFLTSIQSQDIIAVAYRVQNTNPGPSDDLYYGDFLTSANVDTSKNLVLKLIKPQNLRPQYKEAWRLLLKNIYSLNAVNIKKAGFKLQIEYEIPGQNPVTSLPTTKGAVKLLTAFGFDKFNSSGNAQPDNVFDWRPGFTILPTSGEIIFPSLEPFGKNLPNGIPDSLRYQSIYDTTQTFARQDKAHDKWIITGKYSGEASANYQLGFNAVENSARVYLNGRQLIQGIDYVVDYNTGQLTIRNSAALVPGANLRITYEQNDLFQLASKTLLGARGIFNLSDKTKLGFSILNLNQQSLSNRVRIGEEPISNTIMGVDFHTGGDLPFLTRALDNVISTREASSFSLAGEFAYINPDPNTIKSTIPDDHGGSVAYIDDFEGAKTIIPIGVSYTQWKDLSAPDKIPALAGLSYKQMMDYKAKSFWYSITPSNVFVSDIWGNRKKVAKADQQVPVLDFVFMPDTPGTYNYHPKLSDPTKTWGGMMKLLSSTANNLVVQHVEYIEFWVYNEQSPPNANLYIDLGRISEDVIPNKILNTEDKNGNGVIDPGEDVGIDGLNDAQERAKFHSKKADPSGDDFSFKGNYGTTNTMAYFNINGTEGNAVSTDMGRIPDTEDLNGNGKVDLVNSYFRYKVPLDTTKNKFIAGTGGDKGWFLMRIPLRDTLLTVGTPSLSDVEYIRIFTTGVSSTVHVRFADFNLVGNQWQKTLPKDTVLSVSVINYEDNSNYTSPPGVLHLRDKTHPNQVVYLNEQSLDLIIHNLPDDSSRSAVKYLSRSLDVFNYKEMKLFIHGDNRTGPGSISSLNPINYSADVFFRFGSDQNNYYEYRQPIRPGWNDVGIKFSELTAIKQNRDSVNVVKQIPVPGEPNHFYAVKGNPTLTSVKFLQVGIYNTPNSHNRGPISGEVWVNELRVIGADNHKGWAYTFSSSLKLADLMSINFNMSQTDPYFHRLSARFGTRVNSRNWSVSASMNLLKLIPFRMPGSNLDLNFSHTESVGKPLYLPGTDVKVNQAALLSDRSRKNTNNLSDKLTGAQIISGSQTVNISNSISASNVKFKIPTSFWLLKDTFNNLRYGFNYNQTFSRSPTVLSNKTWVWNFNLSYGLNFSRNDYFYPLNIPVIGAIFGLLSDYRNTKIFYAPQSITFNLTAGRNRNINVSRAQGNVPSTKSVSRNFVTTRNFSMNWKISEGGLLNLSTSYSANIRSSLAYLETSISGAQRPESAVWRDIFSGAYFGKPYGYQQSFSIRAAPRVPTFWNLNRYFSFGASYNANYQWRNNFSQKELGKSAGYSTSSQVNMTLRLKSLVEPLFKESNNAENKPNTEYNYKQRNRGRNVNRFNERNPRGNKNTFREPKLKVDTTSLAIKDTVSKSDSLAAKLKPKKHILRTALFFLKTLVKTVFFDYNQISMNFTSSNSVSKSGLAGNGTGFGNFWGVKYNFHFGPSRLYMLGLNSDAGPRAPNPNGNFQDVFSQRNNLDFSTSRPLWKGAKISLNWKVGWSINKNTTLQSDQYGNISVNNISSTGSISRTFFSLPPFLFLSSLKSGINRVHELYKPNAKNQTGNLSKAFVQGFETLPFLSRIGFLKNFANYIPRPNFRISWNGLEKLPLFKHFAERVSLEDAYTSNYTEGWSLTPDGTKLIQTQRINYGFMPLLGLNITFARLWGGNLISSIKYSTSSSFILGISTKNITESFTRNIGITAGYSKSGFELPLFGISLKNDIEFSLSYTNLTNTTIIYNMTNFKKGGIPQDGSNRTTLEPRIRYTISSKVTLTLFYKRSSVQPVGASRIPPTSTSEAGLDVHISIQ